MSRRRKLIAAAAVTSLTFMLLYVAIGWPYCLGSPYTQVRREGVIPEFFGLIGWKGRDERDLRCLLTYHAADFRHAVLDPSIAEILGLSIHRTGEYVEFEDVLCGLRFWRATVPHWAPDREYLQTHKLSDQWWAYERDGN